MSGSLLFVETAAQAQAAVSLATRDHHIVAVTAEASDALSARSIAFEDIGRLADIRELSTQEASVSRQTATLLADLERELRAQGLGEDVPGFLEAQAYFVQYSVAAVGVRASLMTAAVAAYQPDVVSIFTDDVDPWFRGDGYSESPWILLLREQLGLLGIGLRVLEKAPVQRDLWARPRGLFERGQRVMHRLLDRHRSEVAVAPALAGHRILFSNGANYEWLPLVRRTGLTRGRFELPGRQRDSRQWNYAYLGELRCGNRTIPLPVAPTLRSDEPRMIRKTVEAWGRTPSASRALRIGRFDVLPALVPHLQAVAEASPAMAREADAVSDAAIDAAKPDVVAFSVMHWAVASRLASVCRRRGIPTVCYQHGGAYGTHLLEKNERIEPSRADVFLTHGEGIMPWLDVDVPRRARFVPVGSGRVQSMRSGVRRRPNLEASSLRVLWIGEASMRNTYTGLFMAEDTGRFARQRAGLLALSAQGHRVTFRPVAEQRAWDGTSAWLGRVALPRVRVDALTPMARLLDAADLVVTDNHAGTVWGEVLGVGRPMIAFCDPRQTRMRDTFAADLGDACCWCQSPEDFLDALERLNDPGFRAGLCQRSSEVYLRRYVLHNGCPVEDAARAVSSLVHHG